ncbi:MAG TPA: hypothetical protein VE912_13170 [Bacteroidales bacterium]|nr:hypothetical protein [Bacteroidales bacterium]
MYKKIIFLIVPVMLLVFGCRSGNKGSNADADFDVPDSVVTEGELEVSDEAMSNIVQNISSPVEMAALIKALGVPFSNRYLASTDEVDNYNTNFKQALSLGIYGADLGYLNMYNKTTTVIDYLSSIKKLSDALKVGQFFDFTTLKRLATNNTNLDSLMYISVHSFNQMDKYLRENNRSSLSTLIVAGVWIEGLYLATQVAKDAPSHDLAERIGEQKIILNDLMIILNNYNRDPQFAKLIGKFQTIKDLYNDVKITYTKGEPEAVEKDGMLMIIQNDKSIVHITDEQLKAIIQQTEKIRNELLEI